MRTPESFLVLANAHAGSTARDAVAAAVARLAETAATSLRWTDSPDEFHASVEDAPEDAGLVICGGDGSIHLALQTMEALDRMAVPVGIVPLGTGNDFARNHGIPLDPVDAADLVIGGVPSIVPVIELREAGAGGVELVANNMHVGLGVEAARMAKRLKPGLGRLAYPISTAIRGTRSEGTDVRLTVDGDEVWDRPALAALVLLGPNMGGGVELDDTRPDLLDLIVVEPTEPGRRIELVRDALRSRVSEGDRAQHWWGTEVAFTRPGPIDANVDGELTELTAPVSLTYRPDGWCVVTRS